MVQYRRNFVPGGTYFFTVTLHDRRRDWLTAHIGMLRNAVRQTRHKWPFAIDAMVVLPEHLHAIFRLPSGDADYAQRWRSIKSCFSRSLACAGVPVHQRDDGEYDIWQPRYWEHTIRDDQDLAHHVAYIHYNPVKHGYAAAVVDWPHSSFHRYVRMGWLSRDWADGNADEASHGYGE